MSGTRKTSHFRRIVPTAGDAVKGRIVAAGVPLSDLARAAGIAPNTLTNYLNGRLTSYTVQYDIWFAFRAFSSQEISMREFWGSLFAERKVG